MNRSLSKPVRRSGFTLIELMVAISIIALLIGFLLPAISGVRRTAVIRQVSSEISALEGGLTDFKATFGEYPPSRITLHKDAAGWSGDQRSKSIIRKFWPQFDFSGDGAGGTFPFPAGKDFVHLDGPECLTFFLGGVRSDLDKTTYIGFSKIPSQPFSTAGDSRTGPFFKFDLQRIADSERDGPPEYFDTISGQARPYLYLSSYDGRGYDASDLDQDGDVTATTTDKWMLAIYATGTSVKSGHNPKSFQIISPGFDGEYGPGGIYNSKTADSDLVTRDRNGDGTITADEMRSLERDNITNFAGGTLAD